MSVEAQWERIETATLARERERIAEQSPPDQFAPHPLDYTALIADGIPPTVYVKPPYAPAGSSVWAVGPSASAKSMWAMDLGSEISRCGGRVVHISQENPLQVELARVAKLRPDPAFFDLYHYEGFDLAVAEHVERLIEIAQGARLVVADTFSAVWSGDENDNAAVVGFDREVVRPVITETGATFLTLDHTGHPQAFVSRRGVSAPRGASAKGQKADVLLEFRPEGEREFSITHGKNRVDGTLEPKRQFRIEDDEDAETITIVPIETSADVKVRELADAMAAFVLAADGPVSSTSLRRGMTGLGGREAQTEAMRRLGTEMPSRVVTGRRTIVTEAGPRSAQAWWPA